MERTLALSAPYNPLAPIWQAIERAPRRSLLVVSVFLALLLGIPGATVTTRLLEELFAILDGVHRLAWGQVPNLDFHSAVGPLAYYVPGLGYWLTGSFGAAMPLGIAFLLLPMGAILAYILPSRLSPALALPFGCFLLLVLAVPMNLGDAVNALSFGQFYNRVGWVGLSLLLVMFLAPAEDARHSWALDALCAAALVLLLLYSRATYGLVALGFLLFMLTDMRQWRWAGTGLLLACGVAALIELIWNSSLAYWQDVLLSFSAGGWLRGEPAQWLELFLGNFADYVLLGLLLGVFLWRRFDLRMLLFVVFCGAAGFWLLNQNDQRWGILSIHAASAVLAEAILRDMRSGRGQASGPLINPAGIKLYLLGFLFPTMVHCTIALTLHAGTALFNGGQALSLPRLESVRLADLWTPGDFGGSRWYLDLVQDGLTAVESLGTAPEPLLVLGGPNPFALALDLEPPRGDVALLRWGSSQDEEYHTPPEQLLGGVKTVLERTAAGGIGSLGAVYLPAVLENFAPIANTANWRIYQRTADPE
jgi:hypothetical protein